MGRALRAVLLSAMLIAGLVLINPVTLAEPTRHGASVRASARATASASASATASPKSTASPSPSERSTPRTTTLAVSGDMLFHENLWKHFRLDEPRADYQGNLWEFDFTKLLRNQRDYLERADLAICQMETPLAQFGGPYRQYPIFSIPPEVAWAAKGAGYDVCTTASNHSVDQGTKGLKRTIGMLEDAGLAHTGTYRTQADSEEPLVVTTRSGVRVGIVTGTFSLNGLSAEHDWQVDGISRKSLIKRAKRARAAGAEIVVAALHVGTEYQNTPNAQQVKLDRALIDSGQFDFVYNHHSHAVQPLERYHGKWIAYSLGNNISVTSHYERTNNEFLLLRVQFVEQEDGSWATSDVSWAPATNRQDGRYRWCSVARDTPSGVCQSSEVDRQIRRRIGGIVNDRGADEDGAHAWRVTEEESG